MSFINLRNKTIQIKIVYCGPGRGGKTTSLEYINRTQQANITSEMISLKTSGNRTLFFDFIPFSAGTLQGFDTRLQLYTVPGQLKYNVTRKIVLRGVDGIVFVADSRVSQRKHNIKSLKQLKQNLMKQGQDITKIPFVFQYNQRDVMDEEILSVRELNADLNKVLNAPVYLTDAVTGEGVNEAIKDIMARSIKNVQKELATRI